METNFQRLSAESQKDVLAKTVLFQGRRVPVKKLLPKDHMDFINNKVLRKLINNELITIGEKIPDMSCDTECYIPRELHPIDPVKKDIVKSSELNNYKRIIICAPPGMGKSTELIRQANRIQKSSSFSWPWVIYLDLSKLVAKLDTFDVKTGDVFKLLANVMNLRDNTFEKKVFFNYATSKEKQIVVLLDGFDEVEFEYEDDVVDVIKKLSKSNVKQIWISSRKYFVGKIRQVFPSKSYTFADPARADQERFLQIYWKKHLSPIEIPEDKLKKQAETFLDKVLNCETNVKSFINNPLLLSMLATVFQSKCLTLSTSNSYYFDFDKFKKLVKLSEVKLYELFIKTVFKTCNRNGTSTGIRRESFEQFVKRRQLQSLEQMSLKGSVDLLGRNITSEPLQNVQFNSETNGIYAMEANGNLCFAHITFAEYFVATLFADTLKTQIKNSIADFFNKILMFKRYAHIRYFFDQILERDGEVRKLNTNDDIRITINIWLRKQHSNPKLLFTALSLAAASKHVNIVKFLVKCLDAEPACLKVIYNALCYALRKNNPESVEEMLDFVEDKNEERLLDIIMKKKQDSPDCTIVKLAIRRKCTRIITIFLEEAPNFQTILDVYENCSPHQQKSLSDYLSADKDLEKELTERFGSKNIDRLYQICKREP